MNRCQDHMNSQSDIPEDLATLLELTANQCSARHRAAREELCELVQFQNREIAETEERKRKLMDSVRDAGREQSASCEQHSRQRISSLEHEIRNLHQRISPRRKWLLIFERDNESFYAEKTRLEQELESTHEALEPALANIRQSVSTYMAKAVECGDQQVQETRERQDHELRMFHSECFRKTLELESAMGVLKNLALTLQDRSDGTSPLAFVRIGSIRYRLARWDESQAALLDMPWLNPIKRDKGLVVSGSDDPLPWVHSWVHGMLNAFPAGLLRLTLIDPGHLGRPFSRWLELGDSSANLLGGKVWTEPREIETRLSDLKEHVVRVTQRLLRDEFADLHAYNEAHPEAPEPFHLMVVHQPVGGWRGAIPELISQLFINGPRCGVIPCVVLPPDVEDFSQVIQGHEYQTLRIGPKGRLGGSYVGLSDKLAPTWQPDPDCGSLNPTTRLREIADEAARRTTVSVDYESLLRDAGIEGLDAEKRSTAEGLVLPLGRSETGVILRMELGTSAGNHHMLIGGRTGMGKSTLMHAIITTACRIHGPEELQVYLLDYKRGTEFMPYATEKLPQARVVSVESDREFGFSVLRFIDGELERRSRLLKLVGAQSLAEYRRLSGKSLPRMLLVIDEFQVLFSGKDALADNASHMLDQLIRQGRSYGLHVILATQALSPGWSLSANTLSQISVRIALACDERVSRQILGEENKAAQLLTRPGEAVYNDQNGQPLGNHRFQVVHFHRDHLGEQVRRIAAQYVGAAHECTIFDGSGLPDGAMDLNIHAEIAADTVELAFGLSSEMGRYARVALERRHGQNLILFSESRDMRQRHLHSILESLRQQRVEVILLDAASGQSAIQSRVPCSESVAVLEPTKLPDLLAHLRSEYEYTTTSLAEERRGKTLVIHAPQNLQDLRSDPIQALGRPSANGAASDFEWLLRHGPAGGLHCILLTERPGSFVHAIDPRSKLLDLFDLRAATRMSEDEARKVLPDAGASRLGEMGALLYVRNESTCIQYRPFDWS